MLPAAAPGNRLREPLDAQIDRVQGGWDDILRGWRAGDAARQLITRVEASVTAGASVYPADVFRALRETPLSRVRIVILGQDPYHGVGQADGLAFSVAPSCAHPPSLRNIFEERQRELGYAAPPSGSLLEWAQRGVLLLNTALTVEEGRPGSHSEYGWRALTDAIVSGVAQDHSPKVFLLWGAHAQAKAALVSDRAHLVLRCNHPSPLSANRPPQPFIGCGHFVTASAFLARADPLRRGFDWSLPDSPCRGRAC